MSTVNVTFRIDEKLKNQADKLFSELGLTLNAAMNVFLRQSVREQQIPFKLSLDVPNKSTLAAIKEVQTMEKDPSLGKTYTDVDEMMEDLLK